MRDVPADMAREIARMPDARVTTTPSGTVLYVTLDAAGRSANKAMSDVRVRKAFIMAVNRPELAKTVIPGGEKAAILDAICYPTNNACAPTTKPYPYDPAQAKRLLAEAGFANGFDLEFNVYAPIREIGEAIAGQVRVAGIRASTRPLPLSLFVRLRGAGELTAFYSLYPTSAEPDANNILDFFFSGDRDYWKDPLIHKAMKDGETEFDPEKRAEIYRAALDRINEQAYILPVAELPTVWAHSKDVRIDRNPLSAAESRLGDWLWN
jgi:peptide/nickel transport system substrate-binding protein